MAYLDLAVIIGKSNERIVAAAVLNHLRKEVKISRGVEWGKLWGECNDKTEVDLLVSMDDENAVVEAKSTVKFRTSKQLERTAEMMLKFFRKPVLMFSEAPNFNVKYQEGALLSNIHVVAPNRDQFYVHTPHVRRLEVPPALRP